MPLLPLQSPSLVPEAGAAAPAIVISLKSVSVKDTAAQVKVRVVPIVLEKTAMRYADAVPALTVSVPLIVWSALMLNVPIPIVVLPVMVRLLNVFEPVIDDVVIAVDVNDTL